VVFDTETTGLNPQVDEVCQIAAVRVVNGKLLDAERFDMLVNPGRKIPAASTAVHHITDEMVAGAPGVAEAMARFHTFADGCVLVAHNAPFDMAFLRRREREIGRRFDQPILDTVLCSAILFGQSAEHTLDALCDRLSITDSRARPAHRHRRRHRHGGRLPQDDPDARSGRTAQSWGTHQSLRPSFAIDRTPELTPGANGRRGFP
jgi:DNA polymerase III epsilon subunit family exonuclease